MIKTLQIEKLFVRLLNEVDNDEVNHVLMTDEANFHLCGNISSQNCCYWATENPRDIHQKPLHSAKVIVGCGVTSSWVIGPCFFADEAGRAVTVNSARYTEMLRRFLELKCRDLVLKPRLSGFSQIGQWLTLRVLNEMLPVS